MEEKSAGMQNNGQGCKTEKEQRAKAMKRTTKNKLGTSEVMMNLMPLQTFTRCVGG